MLVSTIPPNLDLGYGNNNAKHCFLYSRKVEPSSNVASHKNGSDTNSQAPR